MLGWIAVLFAWFVFCRKRELWKINMADEQTTVTVSFGPVEVNIPIPLKNLFRWFKSGVNILLYGAQGTGKTSFRMALQNATIEEIRKTGRTPLVDEKDFYYVRSDGANIYKLSLHCIDSPGGREERKHIFERLVKNPPLVVLLFVDHYDTRKKMRRDLKPNPSEPEIRKWEQANLNVIGKPSNERIEENCLAIRDLYRGLYSHQILRDTCCLIVPVVTKQDLWETFLRKDYFYDQYHKDLDQFTNKLEIPVTKIMPCSTTINLSNGVYEIMHMIDEETEQYRSAWNRIKKFLDGKSSQEPK
jgi:energy-coupling factor transporter ATP-binding protein EcfA2